jgi:D-alanine-D-alanine ligase
MRIGLTYDLQTDPTDVRQAEHDPPRTIQALTEAFTALGHEVVLLGNAHALLTHPRQLDGVALVFNIAEGRHGRCREAWVPTLLELHGTAYVGSDPLALSLGLDKAASKRLAVASGILTPRWIAVDHPGLLPADIPLAFPVIVKPRYEGSGVGIDEGAVVHDRQALSQRARWLYHCWQEPLVIESLITTVPLLH